MLIRNLYEMNAADKKKPRNADKRDAANNGN